MVSRDAAMAAHDHLGIVDPVNSKREGFSDETAVQHADDA
jgi:hypothetical protein